MLGHFGFSYVGLIFMIMLIVPNIYGRKISHKVTQQRMKIRYLLFLSELEKFWLRAALWCFRTLICVQGLCGPYGLWHLLF